MTWRSDHSHGPILPRPLIIVEPGSERHTGQCDGFGYDDSMISVIASVATLIVVHGGLREPECGSGAFLG